MGRQKGAAPLAIGVSRLYNSFMSLNNNELPPPVVEQAPVGNTEAVPGRPEQAAAPEQASQAGATPPSSSPLTIPLPLPTPPAIPSAMQSQSATAQDNPAQASDDADLIEKEWVTKAKQI